MGGLAAEVSRLARFVAHAGIVRDAAQAHGRGGRDPAAALPRRGRAGDDQPAASGRAAAGGGRPRAGRHGAAGRLAGAPPAGAGAGRGGDATAAGERRAAGARHHRPQQQGAGIPRRFLPVRLGRGVAARPRRAGVLPRSGEERRAGIAIRSQRRGRESVVGTRGARRESAPVLRGADAGEKSLLPAWGAVEGAERSAPAWLLHQGGGRGSDDAFFAHFEALTDDELREDLNQLEKRSGGAIAIEPLPDAARVLPPRAAAAGPAEGAARRFEVRVPPPVRGVSYSSLLRGSADDRPDYDALTGEGAGTGVETGIHAFPRGTRAGRCIHAIFEHIDFTNRDTWPSTVKDELSRHGFSGEWTAALLDMTAGVLCTPLSSHVDLRLAGVPPDRRLNELEFCYPLKPFMGRDLIRLLSTHGAAPGLRRQVEDLEL